MKILVTLAVSAVISTTQSARAEMPDCFDGICLGAVHSENDLGNQGFSLDEANECETFNRFSRNTEKIWMQVLTSRSTNEGQKLGEVTKVWRQIRVASEDPENYYENRKKELSRLVGLIQDKYGKPTKDFGGNGEDNYRMRFGFPKGNNEYSGKDVDIYFNWQSSDKSFVIDETINEETYSYYYLQKSIECDDQENLEKAKKVIPD